MTLRSGGIAASATVLSNMSRTSCLGMADGVAGMAAAAPDSVAATAPAVITTALQAQRWQQCMSSHLKAPRS